MKAIKTNSKAAVEFYNSYILESIDQENWDGEPLETDAEKLEFLAYRFKKEGLYPDALRRFGNYQGVLADWLAGLPTSIVYSNYDILQLAIKSGTLLADHTEKQGDRVIENYFSFMASRIIKMWDKHGIDYKGVQL